jgi:2-polyprenyl-6-methoxyphenol hydroxylase-like FAD-dependent oxidoreductase
MAGLAAARVLADHFERVTVLDRDHLPAGGPTLPAPRKAVPQGRHAHALLAGGARVIAELFPGIMEEYSASGAAILRFNDGFWYQAGGYRASSLIDREVVSASRPFIEAQVRRRVRDLANVNIESGVAVHGLLHRDGWVEGVQIADEKGARTLAADFVVDCSGRSSQAPRWLQEIGYASPEVVEVRCDMRYASMILRRSPGDIDGTFAVIIESPPDGKRAAFLLPIENGQWIATVASTFGAAAPVDEDGFRAIAASLPSPVLHQALSRTEALTPVALHRLASSQRRRYEKLRRLPAGFVATGDSICSFNPVYGQGMSVAVMEAVELGACIEERGNDAQLPQDFYQRASKVIANPWQIAVGADFAYPECTGPKPVGVDIINRYLKRVLLAAQVSPEVNTAMIMVQNLLAPPSSLLRPAMVRQVRRAAREAERRLASGPVGTPITPAALAMANA